MNCRKCGANIGENDMFCPSCGTPVKKANENINGENKGENLFTYERQVNHQDNYNQPSYNQAQQNQQSYGAQNNYGQQNQKNKDSGDIVKVVAGTIIALAVLAAIVFIIYSVISANNKNKKDINNNQVVFDNPSTTTGTGSSTDYTGTATTVSNQKNTSYKVNYLGFKLYIPDDLIYEMDYTNDGIVIGDAMQTWIAEFIIKQASYQMVKQNKNIMVQYFNEHFAGYNPKISEARVETIDGVEFVTIETEAAGQSMLIGYASLNSMYTLCFNLMNENNDFNRAYLKYIASIVKTAEYTGESTYMKTNEKLNIQDVKKVLEKVIDAQPNQ